MAELIITPLGTVSPYPKGNKNCPGFFLEYKDTKIMLDCGNGCTSLLNMQQDLNNLTVFISHLHADHYADLLSLYPTIYVSKKLGYIKKSPHIYVPGDDELDVDEYYHEDYGSSFKRKSYLTDYLLLKRLASKYDVRFSSYTSLKKWQINDIIVKNQKVEHPISTNAFRIETPCGIIVYSADTGPNNQLREFAKDCDLFICEATYLKGQYRDSNNHLYAYEAAMIAKDANAKQLLLTHFWPEIDKVNYLKEAKSIFDNTEVAEEGKKLILRRK